MPRSPPPASATPGTWVERGPVPGVDRPPTIGWDKDVEPPRRPAPRKRGRQEAVKRQPGATPLLVSVRPGLPRRKARLPDERACSRLLTKRQRSADVQHVGQVELDRP